MPLNEPFERMAHLFKYENYIANRYVTKVLVIKWIIYCDM